MSTPDQACTELLILPKTSKLIKKTLKTLSYATPRFTRTRFNTDTTGLQLMIIFLC